jgi:aryl-alcohol dehydrogenase-like predicted oxidoreductase
MMKYNLLGSAALTISEIGFGCMSLKGAEKENNDLVHEAIGMGINFFDTADIYDHGKNEMLLGKALKEKRKEIIIATKVGNEWRKDGSGLDWNPRREHIVAAVEDSLRRLQTDYIDLYQLHGGTIHDPLDETIEAFETLQEKGKIRFYGISSIRPNVIREYIQRSKITSVMMQYSLLDRRPEETCLPLLQENKTGVLARGSLAQGLLINKPAKDYLGYSREEVAGAAAAIHSLSKPKRNATQTAIRFVLQQPAITSAVIGFKNTGQLQEAVKTGDSPLLTDDEMELLKKALRVNFYADHR